MSTRKATPINVKPTDTQYFKSTCIACFVVARAIPRVFEEIPKHIRELASEVSDAWDESGKRG